MPTKPKHLPRRLGAHFTVAEALRAGTTRRRMRAGDLTAPFHGVRRTTADIAAEEKELGLDTAPLALSRAQAQQLKTTALIYMRVAPPGAFICGASAAVLHGYPVTESGLLDVAVIAPHRAPRGKGVSGRRLQAHLVEVRTENGIRISSPATTWAMMARDLTVRELIILGDAIVQVPRDDRGMPQPERADATQDELAQAMNAGRRVGVKKLRAAYARIRVGSSSPLETDYRLDAEDAGLPEPELDVEIRDAQGRRLGISEFAYPTYKVVVEIEGDHHRTSKAQWNRDLGKYRDYANSGWEVVRLTHDNVRVQRNAARLVREVLVRRGWQA